MIRVTATEANGAYFSELKYSVKGIKMDIMFLSYTVIFIH